GVPRLLRRLCPGLHLLRRAARSTFRATLGLAASARSRRIDRDRWTANGNLCGRESGRMESHRPNRPATVRPGGRSARARQARRPAAIHPNLVIEVLDAGRWTTVQDRGRPGLERYGIPPGGAADWFAAAVANRIVGNPQDAALLECTAAGPTLRFDADAVVALTGGYSAGAPTWQMLRIAGGSSLALGTIAPGLRTYIAVRGGIDVPLVL